MLLSWGTNSILSPIQTSPALLFFITHMPHVTGFPHARPAVCQNKWMTTNKSRISFYVWYMGLFLFSCFSWSGLTQDPYRISYACLPIVCFAQETGYSHREQTSWPQCKKKEWFSTFKTVSRLQSLLSSHPFGLRYRRSVHRLSTNHDHLQYKFLSSKALLFTCQQWNT